MRQTPQKIRQLANQYVRNITSTAAYKELFEVAFEAGYLAAVEHELLPDDKMPLPKCLACEEGVLQPVGAIKMSSPPFYVFRCDSCNILQDISEKEYLKIDPKLIHRSKELQHKKFKQSHASRE